MEVATLCDGPRHGSYYLKDFTKELDPETSGFYSLQPPLPPRPPMPVLQKGGAMRARWAPTAVKSAERKWHQDIPRIAASPKWRIQNSISAVAKPPSRGRERVKSDSPCLVDREQLGEASRPRLRPLSQNLDRSRTTVVTQRLSRLTHNAK